MLVVGLVAAGSGCRPARSSGSPASDLSGVGEARLSPGDGWLARCLGTRSSCPHPWGQRGSGTPAGCLPPVRAFPDLGRPGAELLLVPRLEQHIGGVGHLGDTGEGHGDIREGSAAL